ncbi:MAG: sodium:calcium antiporter [Actinomycetota bacterium]|nr:sodium:calcium antiporter [Actinomycetota bacterium]
MTAIILVVAFVVILGGAFLFTNAVEIVGEQLNLGRGAVGSILAAVGTALPETMIPIVAIISALITGGSTAGEIGVGAILGAPFLLATLAMFLVGLSTLGFRWRRDQGVELAIDQETTRRDVLYFLVLFALGTGVGVLGLPFVAKLVVAAVLLGAYAFYVWQTIKSGGESGETPEKLWFWPFGSVQQAPRWASIAQLLVAVALIVGGAHLFVTEVEHLSMELGVPAGLISLILAPLATELPEKFNSVIWLKDGKDTLALGNITGATVFQGSVPVVLGLLFTAWSLTPLDILSVALALVSGGLFYALLLLQEKPVRAQFLLVGGVFYAAFVVVALVSIL